MRIKSTESDCLDSHPDSATFLLVNLKMSLSLSVSQFLYKVSLIFWIDILKD